MYLIAILGHPRLRPDRVNINESLGKLARGGRNQQKGAGEPPRPVVSVPTDLPSRVSNTHYINDGASAQRIISELRASTIRAIAADSEFNFSKPTVRLKSKKYWGDIRSTAPIVISIAAWIEEPGITDTAYIARYVFDVRVPEVATAMSDLFQLRVPFIFHHMKAELFTLWALGIEASLHQPYDTFIAAACLHLGLHHPRAQAGGKNEHEADEIENKKKSNEKREHLLSLVGQCAHYKIRFPFTVSEKDDLRRQFLALPPHEPLTRRQIEYASSDADFTLRIYAAQQLDIVREGLATHLYNVEFPFAIANARVEWCGVHVSQRAMTDLRDGCLRASDFYGNELRTFGIVKPNSKVEFLELMKQLNLLHHFKKKTKCGKLSTTEKVLEELHHLHPAIDIFRCFKKYRQTANDEWLTGVMTGSDGRIHPNHRQLGCHTGRNTCTQPNLVGIGKIFRPIVTPAPGEGILELDYSQVEMGIAGAEYGDEGLIHDYNTGDVYSAAAKRFFADQLSAEELELSPATFKKHRKDLRDRMKPLALAIVYNRQAESIAAEFKIPLSEARRQREKFLALYPKLNFALNRSVQEGLSRNYATTVCGLRRHIEESSLSRITQWTRNFLRNTPIQGSAATVFKAAVIALDREFRQSPIKIILIVHDAVVIECPLDQMKEVAETVQILMRNALRTFYPALAGKIDINMDKPYCWNKDGNAESLEKFLADPQFRLDRPQSASTPPGAAESSLPGSVAI